MEHFSLRATSCDTLPDSLCKAYVKATYPIFEGQKELNQFIDTLVSSAPLIDNGKPNGIELAAKKFIKDYEDYKKEFPDAFAGYEWDQTLSVNSQDKNIISFVHKDYVYTAGAHGLENEIYHNWSKKEERELSLKDLLIENYTEKLNNLAEKIFRSDEGITETASLESYFFENEKFKLNNNFLITSKGLVFIYNPYEIKSYAEGRTTLIIPYSSIQDLIKPDGYLSIYKTQ